MTAEAAPSGGGVNSARYLPVGPFFLNEKIGPLRAWRLLWEQQSDFLGSEGKKIGDDVDLDGPFRALATAKLMARYLYSRYLRADGALDLPVSGELAIERLSGAVKLLDLGSKQVFTIMGDDAMRGKLEERIKSAERVSDWAFAPDFEGADVGQGWLAEEYIPGVHPTGFRGCSERFEDYYQPLLVDFLCAEPPLATPFSAYLAALCDDILDANGLLPRVDPELRTEITEFVGEFRGRLDAAIADRPRDINLVLSHGDFFSGNVIITPDGTTRAIDWATTGSRSALYDLYFLLMNHCVRVMSPAQRSQRFSEMVRSLRSALGEASADTLAALDNDLTGATELRWLFYLECVHVPLMHCVDPDDRYIKSLATRLTWFKEYELAVKDDDMIDYPTAAATSAATTPEGARHA